MENKKRVVILVTVAAVLAIIAIVLNVTGSADIPTSMENSETMQSGPGEVGVQINQPQVEDKLSQENMEYSQ